MPQRLLPALSPPAATQAVFAWAGRYPVSPGWFEVRPARVPRDARPVYDEDIDCITGYHRIFGRTALTYDLLGSFVAIDESREARPTQAALPDLAIGALWQPEARGMTRAGFHAEGAALDARTCGKLRERFVRLSRLPLHFSMEALADMQQAERFVPLHILRLAIRCGCREAPEGDYEAATVRYTAGITRRRVPALLELTVRLADGVILRIRQWHIGAP
ncbi:hypothetical protein LMG31506_04174 [Cupriavidus yeoncheonensis]|uniref:Uncharacterized protein n=1 Tax=Cupriavidus yeoncheonensis TaxID=1462994 RepID=A0A916N5A3_9BURK|nr:hypothetical protein [Cupriavidus yeoncheonensis]CAG2150090.1 hypothetical protein LMG31506_04174 [Cupriavidus yeoncheonensis]